jgi:hypothetical protein
MSSWNNSSVEGTELVADYAMNIGRKEVRVLGFLVMAHPFSEVITRVGHKQDTCTSQILIGEYHLSFLTPVFILRNLENCRVESRSWKLTSKYDRFYMYFSAPYWCVLKYLMCLRNMRSVERNASSPTRPTPNRVGRHIPVQFISGSRILLHLAWHTII